MLVKPTTVNFLRVFAVCSRTRYFLRLLADRISKFLHLELLADKVQFNFFSPLGCSCGARTSSACLFLGCTVHVNFVEMFQILHPVLFGCAKQCPMFFFVFFPPIWDITKSYAKDFSCHVSVQPQRCWLHLKIGQQCVHVWLTIRIKLNCLEKMKDTKISKLK